MSINYIHKNNIIKYLFFKFCVFFFIYQEKRYKHGNPRSYEESPFLS